MCVTQQSDIVGGADAPAVPVRLMRSVKNSEAEEEGERALKRHTRGSPRSDFQVYWDSSDGCPLAVAVLLYFFSSQKLLK
jgi:hypothetical protein